MEVGIPQIAETARDLGIRSELREVPSLCLGTSEAVSYTHLRAHETVLDLVCRLLLENKKKNIK